MGIKGFRYDIGFLRALAVICVLLFHFKVPFFQGGFLGVDIFFVISGYLMTRIILNGFVRDSFSLKTFYTKRIARIFPVLIVVGFFILLVSTLLFLNRDIAQNAKNVVLSSLFVSNIYYWLYNGYFDPASHGNIFLHSWSLSVEWQFYMLYPLLLLAVKNLYLKYRKTFTVFFLCFTMASLVLCLWITFIDNSFAFYMFPSRAWEMTIGGVAFLFATPLEKRFNFNVRRVIALLGYLLILVSMIIIDASDIWPSILTILPVGATFMIIITDVDFKLLHSEKIQFFGNISYSLYLWHWPVLIGFQYFGFVDTMSIVYMTILSILLSVFTYYFIEKKSRFSSLKFVTLSLPLIVIIGLCMFKYPDNKISKALSIYDEKAYALGNYTDYYNENIRPSQFNASGCFITIGDVMEDYNWKDCLRIDSFKQNVLLIGDSHAAQFSQSLNEQKTDLFNLLQLNAGITFPFKNPKGQKESVKLINKFYEEFLATEIGNIDLVLLSMHWSMYKNPNINYTEQEISKDYNEFLQFFKDRNIPVLIVDQQESYIIEYSKIAALQKIMGIDDYDDFIKKYIDPETKEIMKWLRNKTPSSQLIKIYDSKSITKIDANGVPYMVDKNHYSKMGTDQIVQKIILPRIKETLNSKK